MMRTAFLCSAVLVAATPADAQVVSNTDGSSTTSLQVTGSVPGICILGDPKLDGSGASLNVSSLAGRVLQIDQLVDPTTLSTRATRAAVSLDTMCNQPARVTVESANNGLWRQAPTANTPNGFGNAVPYYIDINWDSSSARLDANANTRSPRSAGFSSSSETDTPIVMDLHILPGSTNAVTQAPLLAGEYRDTLTVTVSPQ